MNKKEILYMKPATGIVRTFENCKSEWRFSITTYGKKETGSFKDWMKYMGGL